MKKKIILFSLMASLIIGMTACNNENSVPEVTEQVTSASETTAEKQAEATNQSETGTEKTETAETTDQSETSLTVNNETQITVKEENTTATVAANINNLNQGYDWCVEDFSNDIVYGESNIRIPCTISELGENFTIGKVIDENNVDLNYKNGCVISAKVINNKSNKVVDKDSIIYSIDLKYYKELNNDYSGLLFNYSSELGKSTKKNLQDIFGKSKQSNYEDDYWLYSFNNGQSFELKFKNNILNEIIINVGKESTEQIDVNYIKRNSSNKIKSVIIDRKEYDVNTEELTLNLWHNSDISNIKYLTNLKKLKIFPDSKLDFLSKGLIGIKELANNKKLKSLYLANINFDDCTELVCIKTLEKLHVINCDNIDIDIISQLENLKVLYIEPCMADNIDSLQCLKKLEELYIENGCIEDLGVLNNLNNLNTLYYSEIRGLKHVLNLKDLKNIKNIVIKSDNCKDEIIKLKQILKEKKPECQFDVDIQKLF